MTHEFAMGVAEASFIRAWRLHRHHVEAVVGPVLDGQAGPMPWPCSINTIKRHAREMAERGRRQGCLNAVPPPVEHVGKDVETLVSEHLRGIWWFDAGTLRPVWGLESWMR